MLDLNGRGGDVRPGITEGSNAKPPMIRVGPEGCAAAGALPGRSWADELLHSRSATCHNLTFTLDFTSDSVGNAGDVLQLRQNTQPTTVGVKATCHAQSRSEGRVKSE